MKLDAEFLDEQLAEIRLDFVVTGAGGQMAQKIDGSGIKAHDNLRTQVSRVRSFRQSPPKLTSTSASA